MTNAELNRRAFLRVGGDAMNLLHRPFLPCGLNSLQSRATSTTCGEDFTSLSADETNMPTQLPPESYPPTTPTARAKPVPSISLTMLLATPSRIKNSSFALASEDLQAKTANLYGKTQFADLTPIQQDNLLTQSEGTDFFATIRFLVIAAMFSLPEYGGNKVKIGWQLIGFEDRHAWTQPFGYYDSEYLRRRVTRMAEQETSVTYPSRSCRLRHRWLRRSRWRDRERTFSRRLLSRRFGTGPAS